MGYLKVIIDELVKNRKLGDSLAALPELGQGAQPGFLRSRHYLFCKKGILCYIEGQIKL